MNESIASLTRSVSAAFGTMHFLRQISLDNNILRHSSPSAPKSFNDQIGTDRYGTNYAQHLSSTINIVNNRLKETFPETVSIELLANDLGSSFNKWQTDQHQTLLQTLKEFNSLIVHLIQLGSEKKVQQNRNKEKPKSKLRRHYSALIESGQFLRFRASFSRHDSDNSNNQVIFNDNGSYSKSSTLSSSLPNESLLENFSLESTVFCSNSVCDREEAIHMLIDSQVICTLVKAIPYIDFEEKKLVRTILTNSILLQINKAYLVVDYICESSNNFLQCLVQSYELCQSDVTLNCGCILRFVSQFESVVSILLQSQFFYKFFEYMQRPLSCCPFDVTMDVFFTFKTILSHHKPITMAFLKSNSSTFHKAFVQLLKQANMMQNYVAKRQSLEIFAEIFSGEECANFRADFIAQNHYINTVIWYLWNHNLQVRLRCLLLLSVLFVQSEKDITRAFTREKILKECEEKDGKHRKVYKLEMLVSKIIASRNEYNRLNGESEYTDSEMRHWLTTIFTDLRKECCQSNNKQFISQIPFVDMVIHFLSDASIESVIIHCEINKCKS